MRAASRAALFAAFGSIFVLHTACGGGGGGSTPLPPPAPADFSISLTPANLQIPAGGSGYVTVTASRLNGFTGAITLSGTALPSGVSISGTIADGASSTQMPVLVGAEVAPQALNNLQIHAQSGSLAHDAAFGLIVGAPLPPGHLGTDLTQASGGLQTSGTTENTLLIQIPVAATTAKGGSVEVRHGFLPSGTPAKP